MSEVTLKVTNECICRYCPSCEMGTWATDEDNCPECGTEVEYVEDCFNCYDTMIDCLTECMNEWFNTNPGPLGYIVEGTNMGWRHRSGYRTVTSYEENLAEAIAPNRTGWTQYWSIDPVAGGKVHVSQSHHDAPTGESYTLRPITIEDVIEANVGYIVAQYPLWIKSGLFEGVPLRDPSEWEARTRVWIADNIGNIDLDELSIPMDDEMVDYAIINADSHVKEN